MRVLLIAAVLLAALPVVAQERPNRKGCTHADVLDALERARKWLPADEEFYSVALIGNGVPRTAAVRLREQANDIERVDVVLRACRE